MFPVCVWRDQATPRSGVVVVSETDVVTRRGKHLQNIY